jgi:DNA-binding protein HU-beta
MNKSELVEAVARHLGCGKAEGERALEAVTACVAVGLKSQGEVAIPGFGTFRRVMRKARTGRNPKTGEPLEIPASRSVGFRPGKALKENV